MSCQNSLLSPPYCTASFTSCLLLYCLPYLPVYKYYQCEYLPSSALSLISALHLLFSLSLLFYTCLQCLPCNFLLQHSNSFLALVIVFLLSPTFFSGFIYCHYRRHNKEYFTKSSFFYIHLSESFSCKYTLEMKHTHIHTRTRTHVLHNTLLLSAPGRSSFSQRASTNTSYERQQMA